MTDYPKRYSYVDVTFVDGEVKSYRISASSTISQFLAKQAGETGIITLINDGEAIGIPVDRIREYRITPMEADNGEAHPA